MTDQETPKGDNADAGTPQYVSLEEYKNLQKKLARTQRLLSQAQENTSNAQFKRLEDTLGTIAKAVLKGGNLGGAEKDIERALLDNETRRTSAEQAGDSLKVLAEALSEIDKDWADPELAEAKSAWEAGRTSEAIDLVRQVGKPKMDEGYVKKLVDDGVKTRLRELGVADMGLGTGTPSRRVTRAEVGNLNPKGRTVKSMVDETDKMLDLMGIK